jgi:uncharacterized damage-inducible protein DinB
MYVIIFRDIILRDLNKLKDELNAYADEQKIWLTTPEVKNSAGTLCLHLAGNLQHFIGATLAHTGYVRNRPAEFEQRAISREILLKEIDKTIEVINLSFEKLTDAELEKEYPLQVLEKKTTTAFFLSHLTTHLSYHLGQVNYHRRLLY